MISSGTGFARWFHRANDLSNQSVPSALEVIEKRLPRFADVEQSQGLSCGVSARRGDTAVAGFIGGLIKMVAYSLSQFSESLIRNR
jgi:hypothetical protein